LIADGNMTRRLIVVALWLAMNAAGFDAAAATATDATMCNPFGDPPAITMGQLKPDCQAGDLLGPWKDADEGDRYACVWEPPSAKPTGPLPLVIYLHPSLFGAQTAAQAYLLRYQNSMYLSKDGTTKGYIVLAPQARLTRHYYPRPDEKGLGWDNWYRQLNPAGSVTTHNAVYRENVDAAAIDHFVAEEVATGKVDRNRIYVTGWSNGAAMALLYALNRPQVAAAAVYSAPDPFGAFNDPCPQTPVKGRPKNNSQIRIFNPSPWVMHLHNSCDVAGICPNGEKMAQQLRAAGVHLQDIIIDLMSRQVNQCNPSCGTNPNGNTELTSNLIGFSVGFLKHARWPKLWTPVMLEFLRDHTPPPREQQQTKRRNM
jgi:poly(3-hydroxybutyrate) depolymerase